MTGFDPGMSFQSGDAFLMADGPLMRMLIKSEDLLDEMAAMKKSMYFVTDPGPRKAVRKRGKR